MKKFLLASVCVLALAVSAQVVVTNTTAPITVESSASTEATTWVNKLINYDAQLQNLPFGVLVFVGMSVLCSAFGYMEWFPNKRIPAFSISIAIAFMLLMAPIADGTSLRYWIGKNCLIGMISGFFAFLVAMKWGTNLVDRMVNRVPKRDIGPMSCWAAACLMAFIGVGCTNIKGVRTAAYVGTSWALQEKPEWRPHFEKAHADLLILEQAEVIGLPELLEIIQRLPVKELKSDEARIIIVGTVLLIEELGANPEVNQVTADNIRKVVKDLRSGMKRALDNNFADYTPDGRLKGLRDRESVIALR